jgi:Fic family protein
MRQYDYSFIKGLSVKMDIVGLASKIELFRAEAEERKKRLPEVFAELEAVARVQSVKGSNEIEGIVTSDERIREIVNKSSAPLNHDEMEIAGYRDVLDWVHNNHKEIKLDGETILEMHRMMLSRTPEGGGRYKDRDNAIISVDRFGRRSIRFKPVPAEGTPEAMEQLVLAYMDAMGDSRISPIFLIPCFILDFLCIHPFPDGNGRMSRLLSLLLMYKSGIDVGKYISFEGHINESKQTYYEALRRSSEGWHENSSDYNPFIEDFVLTLFLCYQELDRRFSVIGDKKVNKGNRIEALVMGSPVPISKKEIMEILPDISETRVEEKLSELMKNEKIEKRGSFKDARYIRK